MTTYVIICKFIGIWQMNKALYTWIKKIWKPKGVKYTSWIQRFFYCGIHEPGGQGQNFWRTIFLCGFWSLYVTMDDEICSKARNVHTGPGMDQTYLYIIGCQNL